MYQSPKVPGTASQSDMGNVSCVRAQWEACVGIRESLQTADDHSDSMIHSEGISLPSGIY